MNKSICVAAFVAGLLAVAWVGAGYIGHSALALAVTALIGAVHVAGAVELLRFHRATAALERALANIPDGLPEPGDWLGRLPPSLRNPVRLRLEGERAALPGPAVTPYLVGLLVLLGMLGTFLGMVVTLNGAVVALESTTDLHAIRSALSAPVKGLGVAFGTSVAGVAASAMLGLMSALCRRARLQASQLLDTKIATDLRGFSRAHQRQETFRAVQQQAQALPEVVGTLQAMMAQMERQQRELNERLFTEQQRFYQDAREAYSGLAESVGKSLGDSLTESARLAGDAIRPAVEATMAGIARETADLQQRVADTVTAQLDGLSTRFDGAVATVSDTWTAALARHEHSSESVARSLQDTLTAHADTVAQRSAALLASVEGAHAGLRAELAATTAGMAQETRALHAGLTEAVGTQLDGIARRFGAAVDTVSGTWTAALARHEQAGDTLNAELRAALGAFAETFGQRSASLLAGASEAASALRAELAAADQARLAAQTEALAAMTAALRQEWQQAGEHARAQQERICEALDDTARDIAAAAQAQAGRTIEQMAGLMQTAAEAPRAAAEVIGELRRELSASIARDNEMLAERNRIMETLGALLAAINHASTEQREAIDALVASSAAALETAGSRFAERVDAESAKMADAASQVAGGAVEVASLTEAFGLAVQLFGDSSAKLMETLQRVEGALDKSMARSDEQLAYYVAQAREIIDLSLMSQKRIVDDLQQISGRQPSLAGEV
ncbi:DUF802 domain-containing protein [Thauera sinica]|uniref:DUF802 domain-containing protein n=1 Tax=Thauera sinica TaxID=2665146 RepID=A0ABW1AXV9_9RHOO|nr:DUF802 domain-containing protein [Thauera sp. K11]ATE61215.1 DUF802 domain-containing protein [Thauera sp. K11]